MSDRTTSRRALIAGAASLPVASLVGGAPAKAVSCEAVDMAILYDRFGDLLREYERVSAAIELTEPECRAAVCAMPEAMLVTSQDIELIGQPDPNVWSRHSIEPQYWCFWDLEEKLAGDLSPSARHRAEELYAVWRQHWDVDVAAVYARTGRDVLDDEQAAICDQLDKLCELIERLPATTARDWAIKAHVVEEWTAAALWDESDEDRNHDFGPIRRLFDNLKDSAPALTRRLRS